MDKMVLDAERIRRHEDMMEARRLRAEFLAKATEKELLMEILFMLEGLKQGLGRFLPGPLDEY